MFWYRFGRLTGYLVSLSFFAYIIWDAWVKTTKSESVLLNILVLLIVLGYNGVIKQLQHIAYATEYVAGFFFNQTMADEYVEQQIGDFEKLLNDFGDSGWKIDKD